MTEDSFDVLPAQFHQMFEEQREQGKLMWQALSVAGVISGVLLSLAFQNRQIRIDLQAAIPVASIILVVISLLFTLTLLIYIYKSNFFRIRALRYLELLEERFMKEEPTEYSVYPKETDVKGIRIGSG